MANFTKQHIKETFQTLLEERPLNEISVKLIVETCGINRKSFYYHYQDIPALLEEIIAEDTEKVLEECADLHSLEACLTVLLRRIMEHRQAVLHLYASLNRDVYERNLMKQCDYTMRSMVEHLLAGRRVRPEDRELVVALYRDECFGILMRWLMDGMKEDLTVPLRRACQLREGLIEIVLDRCAADAQN